MVSVRPRTDSDVDACITVLTKVHQKDGYPVGGLETARNSITGSNTLQAWIVEAGCQVVGHAALFKPGANDETARLWLRDHPDDRLALLGRLFVDPEARGDGAAQKLMDTATKYAEEKDMQVVLLVLNKDHSARKLYDRLGWKQYATTIFSWGDAMQMEGYCYAAPREG